MLRHKSKYIVASGFILVLALMIAFAAVGLTRMAAINHHMERIAHKHNVKIDLLLSMRNIVRERSLSMYAMFHMDDPFRREEEFARFTGMAGEFIQLRERLEQTDLDEKERDILKKILALIRTTQPLQVSLVDKIIREDLAGVKEEMHQKDLPLERQILAYFDEAIDHERQATREAVTLASQEYRSAYRVMVFLTVVILASGLLIASYVIYRTRRIEEALAQEKEQAETTLHSVGDGVITADAQGNVGYLNPVAEQLTGWRKEEALGQPLRKIYRIINETTRKPLEHPAMLGVLDGPIVGADRHTLLVSRSGREFAVEDTAAPIRNGGENVGAILVFRDVTPQRHMQKQLSWQASHDPLTGLANRREFEAQLGHLLANAKEQNKQHALLYLDLDQFKVINDTRGHVAGDELLRQLAGLMRSLIRDSDTLARLGGDEFGILLAGCSIPEAERIAQKLLESLEDFRFVWQDKTFRVGVSIGLVSIHAASGTAASVLSAADAACYLAKDRGRNRVWVHRDDDRETAHRRGEMEWVSRIMRAFDENRFVLYFQRVAPVTAVAARDPPCREVLIRMLTEKNELVSPMAFIPAAERYGMMNTVDRWVIRTALAWLAAHPTEEGLAINLSSQSLSDEGFLDFILEQFRATNVASRRVSFEITETAAIANWNRALELVSALRARGCRFALDDFGSGMSSFAYLKNFPVDFIKIDGAFVRDMAQDEMDYAMVEAINRIGHVMGIRTIAEYVEKSEETLEKLRQLGVDYAQGYGIHVPEPLDSSAAARHPPRRSPSAEEKSGKIVVLPTTGRPV